MSILYYLNKIREWFSGFRKSRNTKNNELSDDDVKLYENNIHTLELCSRPTRLNDDFTQFSCYEMEEDTDFLL